MVVVEAFPAEFPLYRLVATCFWCWEDWTLRYSVAVVATDATYSLFASTFHKFVRFFADLFRMRFAVRRWLKLTGLIHAETILERFGCQRNCLFHGCGPFQDFHYFRC